MNEYDGRQFVGIDLHRQRSVIVRQAESGEQLSAVRIVNDPVALQLQLEDAGADPEVVLEATYGWYWAVDVLQAHGARVHLAHPLGVKGFRYRRVKNDVRDAADLADLLRMGRLPEAWIAPPPTRELRELVRYRAKLVAIRSGLKAQVHAVLAKAGVLIAVSDLFGVGGRKRLAKVPLAAAYAERVRSLLELIDILDVHEARFAALIAKRLDTEELTSPSFSVVAAKLEFHDKRSSHGSSRADPYLPPCKVWSDGDEWSGDGVVVDGLVGAGFAGWFSAGEGQPDDGSLDGAELVSEATGVVGQFVAFADVFDLGCDLGVAARGHVEEEVVFDLVAQVARQDVKQW
jgi:hypothetical protein